MSSSETVEGADLDVSKMPKKHFQPDSRILSFKFLDRHTHNEGRRGGNTQI